MRMELILIIKLIDRTDKEAGPWDLVGVRTAPPTELA